MTSLEWLPGAKRLLATEDGGDQLLSFPPRFVLHTTEGGGTVESLAAFYRGSTFWPNLTADVVHREIAQHIPFSKAGRALQHPSGTVDTNRAHCWQVEIIGWAADGAMANGQPRPSNMVMPHLADDQLDWLGEVLAPMFDELGLPRVSAQFVVGGAGLHAPQRFNEPQWRAFSGMCGHQHVINNDHYDPGFINSARILAATHGTTPPATVPPTTSIEIPEEDVDQQTDLSMRLDAKGCGWKPLVNVKAVDCRSWGIIATRDPALVGTYDNVGVVSLTIGHDDGWARFVVTEGIPNGVVSVRVRHK